MSKGSYITTEFTEDILGEIRRLGLQVNLFWKEEKKIYQSIRIPKEGRIIEIGSGPGFYSNKLSQLYPSAEVTSFEYDKTFVEYHKDFIAENGLSSIEVIQGDILGEEEMSGLKGFDLLVSRMVLEHLPNPESIFKKLISMVKPGGYLVILDNDFSNHLRTVPHILELDKLYDAYCRARLEEGGDPYIGRRLPQLFMNEKLEEVQYKTVTAHTFKTDKSLFLGAESSGIGMSLVKKGFLEEAVFKDLLFGWSKMAQSNDNVMIRELYCCIGQKPLDWDKGDNSSPSLASKKQESSKSFERIQLTGEKLTPPRNPMEKALARIWSDLLKSDTVGINKSFFHMGGESFHIPLMLQKITEAFDIELMITDIFEYPTIKDLAGYLSTKAGIPKGENRVEGTDSGKKSEQMDDTSNPFARLKKK